MGHTPRAFPPPILITCLSLGCLEPPTLDDLEPPLADLGGVLSWGPLDPINGDSDSPDTDPGGGPDDPGGPGGPGDSGDGPGSEPGESAPPDPALAQLRLTEVLVDPEGRDGGADSPELIEIWNPGPSPVPLAGLIIDAASWPLLAGDELGLAGQSLAVGGLLIVRRYAQDVDASLAVLQLDGPVIAIGFAHSGGLRNADGLVRLGSAAQPIDELVYGAPPDPAPATWLGSPIDAPGSGRSLCRDTNTSDHDDASDWFACTPNPGQLGATTPQDMPDEPKPIPVGALQIVEAHVNPPGPAAEEKTHEFIELLNTTEVELELAGCRVGDDPSIDATGVDPLLYLSGDGGCASPTCLAPGRRALIVGQAYAGPVGDALVLSTDDSNIADGGLTNSEPVVLWDSLGTAVSSYRLWEDPSVEPLPLDEQPLHRIDPAAPDEPGSWISAPASPGQPN